MFYIKIPYLDLDKTFDSNQSLNWYQVRPGKYWINDGGYQTTVEQGRNEMVIFSCKEEEFFEHWYHYFDCEGDYLKYDYTLKQLGKKFKKVAVRGKGIRIINRDIVECLIVEAFRNGMNNNQAEDALRTFKRVLGNPRANTIKGTSAINKWYDLPDIETMLKNYDSVVNTFRKLYNKTDEKKVAIWALRTLKFVFEDYVEGIISFKTKSIIEALRGYDFDEESIKRIGISGLGLRRVFIAGKYTELALRELDYLDHEEFLELEIYTKRQKQAAAYIKLLLDWDYMFPPKIGDEILWA